MKYLIYPLKLFLEKHLDIAHKAQKEIYPEEEVSPASNQTSYYENGRVLAAFDKDRLIGFNAFILCMEPRSNEFFASSLWFQVEKNYRNHSVGGILIKRSEDLARSFGCSSYKQDAPVGSSLDKLFNKRKEYKKESVIFNRSLL